MGTRAQLRDRLAAEFDDAALADAVVQRLNDATVITGVDLPRAYDSSSGQRWTRDRVTWIATDLFARTRLATSTDWASSRKVTP